MGGMSCVSANYHHYYDFQERRKTYNHNPHLLPGTAHILRAIVESQNSQRLESQNSQRLATSSGFRFITCVVFFILGNLGLGR